MSGNEPELAFSQSCDPSSPRFAHYRLRGLDPARYGRFREKLLDAVEKLLDTELNCETGATARDELKMLTSGMLDYAKAKLAQPTLENERVMAEAAEKFAAAKRELAEARKIDAQAETIEFQNRVNKLRLLLKMSRATVVREKDEAAVLFSAELDDLIRVVDEYQQTIKAFPAGDDTKE